MAALLKIINLLLIVGAFFGSSLTTAEEDKFRDEIPNPESVQALKRFWNAFEEYESQKKKSSVEEFERAREGLLNLYSKEELENRKARISYLEEAIQKYKTHLEKFPNANNRPYVLLNLAQIYAQLSSLQFSEDADAASKNRILAITHLKTIDDQHRSFPYLTDALYLRATLLELVNDRSASMIIWRKLASTGSDRFAVHANLVVGDYEFENANPNEAIKYYKQAQNIQANMQDQKDRNLDELRIHYRLAWANFKAGHHMAALESSRKAASPGVLHKALRQREKIARDIAELIGYCLYENDQDKVTFQTLAQSELQSIGGTISLVLIQQYMSASLPERAHRVSEYGAKKFPLSAEYPDLLRLKAQVEDRLKKSSFRTETLEKLSLLLPQKSLWRSRHIHNLELISYMEKISRKAAHFVASEYYEDGLKSGNPKKFQIAATHYQMLLEDQPNDPGSFDVRLKIANCFYFSADYLAAEKSYLELIDGLKTPEETLSIAHYQLVLARHKKWHERFESVVQKNQSPQKDSEALIKLKEFEDAVIGFNDKYPNESRSIDLLLSAASANRDHNAFDKASVFWQRALLSKASDGQRAIAIRGMIFSKIRDGQPEAVIESVSNFLKLESPNTLSQNLRLELMGVLTSAVNDEASKLSKAGKPEESGLLLIRVAQDFKDLPQREQLWRDGAYFTALGGNWSRAQSSAEGYLKEGHKKYAADMTYLLGRSHEFQMRFGDAVTQYLNLASKYPSHGRSLAALDRAEKLAVADDNFQNAAKAARLRADRAKNHNDRLDSMDAAVEYLAQGGQADDAISVATARKSSSKSTSEKLAAEISIAQVRYKSGDKQTAVDDLDSIGKQLERNKYTLGDSYKRLSSQVNLTLGEHALEKFRSVRISSNAGKITEIVDKKTKYFEESVTRLDKVASLDQPESSPRARYLVAQAATEFADQISAIPDRAGEPSVLKNQTRFHQNITRLRDLATRYHGNNLLAKQRSPEVYARNEWITRSAYALSNSGNDVETTKRDLDQLSAGLYQEMPQKWSH